MNNEVLEQNPVKRIVHIPANGIKLEGALVIPNDARGIVLFAHGSGSSRHSPRNNFVAEVLQGARLGTLLLDLLTRQKMHLRKSFRHRPLTAPGACHQWLMEQLQSANRNGYFASTARGCGAAGRGRSVNPFRGFTGAVRFWR
jgi:predicted alpha/beta-hydrolase family hydrolase